MDHQHKPDLAYVVPIVSCSKCGNTLEPIETLLRPSDGKYICGACAQKFLWEEGYAELMVQLGVTELGGLVLGSDGKVTLKEEDDADLD